MALGKYNLKIISCMRVCCATYTVIGDENRRFPPEIDYVIFLCDAMFEFADVTKNGSLRWNIPLFAFAVHWRLLFKRYIETIVLTSEDRKHEWNNLYY